MPTHIYKLNPHLDPKNKPVKKEENKQEPEVNKKRGRPKKNDQ